MKDYVVAILILYAIVSIILAICIFTDKKGPCASKPLPNGNHMDRDFGLITLLIIGWPILVGLLIVIGIPMLRVDRFLCTPGFSCCGLSCAKYCQPRKPKPAAGAQSAEHSMEAGLAPAALSSSGSVIAVPPPAYTVMELTPIPKTNSSSTAAVLPPSYIR